MKSLFYLAILILLLVFLYIQGQLAYNRITFGFRFISTEFSVSNINQLLSSGATQTNVTMSATVINKNPFPFVIKDLSAVISYKGTVIAQTVPGSTQLSQVIIPANSQKEVVDSVTVFINQQAIALSIAIAAGQKPSIDYVVKASIYGITFTFKSQYTWGS